jgi:hypothetical protein
VNPELLSVQVEQWTGHLAEGLRELPESESEIGALMRDLPDFANERARNADLAGWPVGALGVLDVVALHDYLQMGIDQSTNPQTRARYMLPTPLFQLRRLSLSGAELSGAVELWESASVNFEVRAPVSTGRTLRTAFQLARERTVVAEQNKYKANGWHLHPVDEHGRHLRYRLLFDPSRTQDEMSWEEHGGPPLPVTEGDPARAVLRDSTARTWYHDALRAIGAEAQLRGIPFNRWARRFESPSPTKSYFAFLNRPSPGRTPRCPTQWG